MKAIITLIITTLLVAGCASVPMTDPATSNAAKTFPNPSEGKAGLYVYRHGSFGSALKKDIWVDGECLGQSAPNVFFFREVSGNQNHTIATESEFSPNVLNIQTEAGKLLHSPIHQNGLIRRWSWFGNCKRTSRESSSFDVEYGDAGQLQHPHSTISLLLIQHKAT